MTRSPTLFIALSVLMLSLCAVCIYAQLLSGYSGTGVGGIQVPNDASLRKMLGITAFAACIAAIASSSWAVRISTGLLRGVAILPLLISLGAFSFAILRAIF